MSYLVLARKYRPQRFDDLVGQEHVTTTLVNALQAKRLAHAYIFSGPRGCGKTTTARLLAMALNCEKGPTPAPCGQCPQCQDIASGQSVDDVLEIDGASNRGIDQIRELRDMVKYAPARSRYRISIIDEAHQITDAGFNALLKTLEEPPAHAVFMMATTEMQKIPATIVSRCQRFQLRPISSAESQKRLEEIVKAEKIAVEPAALADVARAAHGSLRDALSLLDQVIAYSPDRVTAENVRSLLGLLPRELVRDFSRRLQAGDPEDVLRAVKKAVEDGFDLFQLAHDLTDYWHGLLLAKCGAGDPLDAEDAQAADAFSLPALERFLQTMTRCAEQMRRSEAPRVTFELAALDACRQPLAVEEILDRLAALEASLAEEPAAEKKPAPQEPKAAASVIQNRETPPTSETVPPKTAPRPQPLEPQPATLNGEALRRAWGLMLEEIGKKKPSIEPFLAGTRWEFGPDNAVLLHCTDDFQQSQLEANLALVRDCLRKHAGGAVTLRCLRSAPPPSPAAEVVGEPEEAEVVEEEPAGEPVPPEPKGQAVPEGELDPALKKILTKFPGKLKKIQA